MRKICPQCQGIFDAQFLCPHCGVSLIDGKQEKALSAKMAVESAGRPQLSMARRFLAGVLLAQGLCFAIAQMSGAIVQWTSVPSLFDLEWLRWTMHAAAIVFGALVAGAACTTFVTLGGMVGFANALLLIGTQLAAGAQPPAWTLLAILVSSTLLGILGAFVGNYLLPTAEAFVPPLKLKAEKSKSVEITIKAPPAPLPLIRVLMGAALSACGAIFADSLRDYLIFNSYGAFGVDSRLQSQFTAWAIAALAMILGGSLAGAASRAGGRNGFIVGILACVGIFVAQLRFVSDVLPAQRFFASMVGLPDQDAPTLINTGLFLLFNTLLLSVLGGFFSSKLLPRVVQNDGTGRLDRGAI